MKFTVSSHDLWDHGHNVVSVLPPSPGDLFAEVLINGKLAMSFPITEHDRAVRVAHAFARRVRGERPVVVKVLCLTAREAGSFFNFSLAAEFAKDTPEQARQTRDGIRTSCINALRTSNDPLVRADAMDVLQGMGDLQDLGVTP